MNKIIYDIKKIKTIDIFWYYENFTNQKNKVKLGIFIIEYIKDKLNLSFDNIKHINLIKNWLKIESNDVKNEIEISHKKLDKSNNIADICMFCVSMHVLTDIFSICTFIQWVQRKFDIKLKPIFQYTRMLVRTIKQFNTENQYSKIIEQISKKDVDKLELVDWNMLLDISNEHYNIDLQAFNYDNIFSRRNLIELIRREYQ